MDWKSIKHKYHQSGILVDTNLLLMLLIGIINKRLIGKKRTEKYTEKHYYILVDFIKDFRRLITTPHILTEVSNLGGAILTGQDKENFFGLLRAPSLFDIKSTDEIVIERNVSRQAVEVNHIRQFGLTDSAIIKLCTTGSRRRPLLLSDDFELVRLVFSNKGKAINFNHILDDKLNL
ncbi:MAG: hypothetical protein NTX45_22935 [Proteobacteria bacterium]|nr:hypothetical protein [Pseudomonadota bacterium]